MPESSTSQSILLVEDSPSQAIAYMSYLQAAPYTVTHVVDGEHALQHIGSRSMPDVVLLDLGLPGIQGMDVLKAIRNRQLQCQVIVITDYGSIDVAVEAMRNGAYDFLAKPFDARQLKSAVRSAISQSGQSAGGFRENAEDSRSSFHNFVGTSQCMVDLYRMIKNAAPSKATVFILGESGTGKELSARALHNESTRADQPFVAINCAAIPQNLMESEVFGHVKGAFTGADSAREGALEHANGGTLFLDEICDMHLDLQAKFLRIVQTGTFQRVGSNKTHSVDVRFVCATNKIPLEEVRIGRFREDLYYRLHVIPLTMPPLRERPSDIPLIAAHFLDRYSREEGKSFRRFSPEAAELLRCYGWPGNVRELMNILRNIVVLNSAETVQKEMLPPALYAGSSHAADIDLFETELPIRPMHEMEKEIIENAVARCAGNISQAAGLLGMSPSTIYRKRLSWESD